MPIRKIAAPLEVALGWFVKPIANVADARVIKYYNSDFGASLNRANQTGEDLSNTAFGRFVVQSALTFPGRFSTLFNEVSRLPQAAMVWTWTIPDYIQFVQFFLRLAVIYLAFKMLGRENVLALVGPDSLFFTEDAVVDTNTPRQHLYVSLTGWAAAVNPLL